MSPSDNRKREVEEEGDDEETFHKKRRVVDDRDDAEALSSDSEGEAPSSSRGRRRKSHSSEKPPEAGIILSVYAENFMCHRKLRVDLCRNVNFIHGQNGSGKSAILAAIQICLGAGARRTHRARNLKDLVLRDGTHSPSRAVIRVTLLNMGSDAYKHDIYGDSITVERTINLQGGYNGYKLLDHTGKEKSRSKKDLDDMLDVLNIQVENPVAVLDQEEAKKFLMGKEEDKYKFFMKATELERIDKAFASTIDTVTELSNKRERVQLSLSQLEQHFTDAREKWKEHQAVEKLEAKVRDLNHKYAWSCYYAKMDQLNNTIEALDKFRDKVAQKQEELTQAEQAMSQPGAEQKVMQERIAELESEAREQAALKRELENQLKASQAPSRAIEHQLQGVSRQLKQAKHQHEAAKQRLQEARDNILKQAGSAESEGARRAEQLKIAEARLLEARGAVNELKQAVSSALRSYEELEPQVNHARSKVGEAKRQMQGIQTRLQELRSSSGDSFAVLGQRVRMVHEFVERAKRDRKFTGQVLGPIGPFVKIAKGKEEFATIAEIAIGQGILDRFIVTNSHDRRVLQGIREKVGCSKDCGILQVTPHPRYKIPDPPVPDIETVATVLSVDDDLVFNCLVDYCRIEAKALGRTREETEQKLLMQSHDGDKIRGSISEVYYLPKGDHWTVKGGSLAVFSNEKKANRTIGVDRSEAITAAEQELAQLDKELKSLASEESRLQHEHTDWQRKWNRAKKAMQENDALISDLSSSIEEIKADAEASTAVAIDTTEYEDDVAQTLEAIEKLKEKAQTLRDELANQQPQIEDIKNRLDDVTIRNVKILADLGKAEEELTRFAETQSQQRSLVEKKRSKVEQYNKVLSTYEENVASLQAEMCHALSIARKLSFRILASQENLTGETEDDWGNDENRRIGSSSIEPTDEDLQSIEPPPRLGKTPADYEARIKRAKEKLKQEREKRELANEDPEVAYEKYIRAKKLYEARLKELEAIDSEVQELSQDIRKRRKKWRYMRSNLEKTTAVMFNEMLKMNKYTGELAFDHDSNSLTIAVGKMSSSGGQTKDIKGLSGGERSYTTISLLLALGENLETPFRVLDEFDVFLDSQARKLTIEQLILVAKRMEHRQFIFITPQDLSNITPDNKLRIHKLLPPTRYEIAGGLSQQTLPFSSQAD